VIERVQMLLDSLRSSEGGDEALAAVVALFVGLPGAELEIRCLSDEQIKATEQFCDGLQTLEEELYEGAAQPA